MFLVSVIGLIYYLYPKTNLVMDDDFVRFSTINANVIMISENPDFSNPRYIDLSLNKNTSINLAPGTYYWKADNGIISGFTNEFTIESEVGMKIEHTENDSRLVNIGNVKINVTKSETGGFVGHVILSPEQSEMIEDSGEYIGREDGK